MEVLFRRFQRNGDYAVVSSLKEVKNKLKRAREPVYTGKRIRQKSQTF